MVFITWIHNVCMTIVFECQDYGFECEFKVEGTPTISLIEKLRDHFEDEHGINYSTDVVIQMAANKGHSLESIKNE